MAKIKNKKRWPTSAGHSYVTGFEKFGSLLQKFNGYLWPSSLTSRSLPKRNENQYLYKIHSGFIHNCKKLETTQVTFHWGINCVIAQQ